MTPVIQKHGEWYVAWIKEIPGVNTQGRTLAEARRNLCEALQMVTEINRELASKGGQRYLFQQGSASIWSSRMPLVRSREEKRMTNSVQPNIIDAIDQKIAEHHLLKSPFYQAWTTGTLTRASLALYAVQYYQHVRAFPEYLESLAERADSALRPLVEENLAEELDPSSPHQKLWRDFAAAVGAGADALDTAGPLPGVAALVETYRELCEKGTVAEAVAALYAYEAQVPEIATQKIDGLRRFYGVTEPAALRYFAVHEEADVRHRAAWREWLAAQPGTDQAAVLLAAERALRALRGALDAVYTCACSTN